MTTAVHREIRRRRSPAPVVILVVTGLALLSSCAKPSHEKESPAPAPPLAGHWTGEAAIAGLDTVAIEIDLGQVDSRWVGQYDVADYNVEDYPVDVEVDSLVTLEFSGVEADFRGRLADGKLTGSLLYEGRPHATVLTRTGDARFSEGFLELEAAGDPGTSLAVLSPDARELKNQFNADRDRPRLVLLLSPS